MLFMKKIRLLLFLASAALVAGSCTKTETLPGSASAQDCSHKITKAADFDSSRLLVKLDNSDDGVFAALVEDGSIVSFEKLFPSTPGKEESEAAFGLDRWYVVTLSGSTPLDDVARKCASIESVALVEYDNQVKKESDCITSPYTPVYETLTKAESVYPFNDPGLKQQWHYYNVGDITIAGSAAKKGADINVLDSWKTLCCGDPEIIVAVVDEGVKWSHPDLKANMWVNTKEIPGNGIDDDGNGYVDDVYGYNFVDMGDISWTKAGDTGHGTHCAGTIAAVNNNNLGVSGVAGGSGNGDGCRIMSCQIFSGTAGGTVSATAKAIKYAADMGASVISCSFGYNTSFASDNEYISRQGSAEIDAVHYFEAQKNNSILDGNVAIFAAGNDAHNYAHYPGAYHDIISVTAFGPDFLPAYYTNYGPGCNVIAPGGEVGWATDRSTCVLSTLPSEVNDGKDYGYMQGTSMACPHVSGITALALSYAKKIGKKFTRDEFKSMIISSANDMDSRLKGSKTYSVKWGGMPTSLDLAQFYHKLGTGSIDTWILMMQIEGVPSILAKMGEKQWIDLSPYFGTASASLTYLSVSISDEDSQALGLAEDPYIEYGRLWIHPTKMASGKFTISAVGGGSTLGGGDNPPGGMSIEQKVSIISKPEVAKNGGWL